MPVLRGPREGVGGYFMKSIIIMYSNMAVSFIVFTVTQC